MRWSLGPGSRRTPIGSRCSAETVPGRFSRSNRSVRWRTRFSMSWSSPLTDEWRRYLEQQIELGGSEVVLTRADRWTDGQADRQTDEETNEPSVGPTVQPSARPPVRSSTW